MPTSPTLLSRFTPRCSLLQNSALISRWAALRAAALGAPAGAMLYGPSLGLADAAAAPAAAPAPGAGADANDSAVSGDASAADGVGRSGGGKRAVVGSGDYYQEVADLELRTTSVIGVEVRPAMTPETAWGLRAAQE